MTHADSLQAARELAEENGINFAALSPEQREELASDAAGHAAASIPGYTYVEVQDLCVGRDEVIWFDGRAKLILVQEMGIGGGSLFRIEFIRNSLRHRRVLRATDRINVWR